MKKIIFMLIGMIFSLSFWSVKADMVPISVDSYANEVTVGTTVTYVVKGMAYEYGTGSNLDGKFIYDTTKLEYINITCSDPAFIEGETIAPTVKITKNVNGELEYKVENEYKLEGTYQIEITFKVKEVPSEGALKVDFYPTDSETLYGAKYVSIGADVLGNTKIEDKNEFYYPEEDEVEDNEGITNNEEDEKATTCKNNKTNIILLISSIISIVLNAILIIILFIKTNKKIKEK